MSIDLKRIGMLKLVTGLLKLIELAMLGFEFKSLTFYVLHLIRIIPCAILLPFFALQVLLMCLLHDFFVFLCLG